MSIRRVVANIKSAYFDESRKFYTEFLGFDVAMDMGWIVTFRSRIRHHIRKFLSRFLTLTQLTPRQSQAGFRLFTR